MDLEKSKLSLKSSDLDLKNGSNVVAVIEWHNEAGEVVEGTLPETTKLKVNGVDTTYTTEEKGNSSELTFTCDSVGTHEITVDGLGEGVPALGPVTLTVVGTTPVVDLEKTVVSINPETYDVGDRDNTVLKFEWKDQFGNPINNTLPEDVKINVNGSDIVPNPKENGDNTEVTIKSTVAKTYEVVVTDLKTSEVKVSFTVTDVRSGVVDPTKTTFTLTSTEHWLKDGKVNIKFKATVKDFYNKSVPINLKHFTIKSNGILVPSINGAKGTGNVNLTVEVTEVGEYTYELFYKDVKHASDVVVNVTYEPVLSKTKVTLEKTSIDLKDSDVNSLLLEWFDSDSNPAVNTLPGDVSFTIDGTPVETTTTENGISTKVSFKVPSTVGKKSITIKGLGDSDFGPYEFDIVDTTPVFDASKSTWDLEEVNNGQFKGSLLSKDQYGNEFNVTDEDIKLFINGEVVPYEVTPLTENLTSFYLEYQTPGTHVVTLEVLGIEVKPDKEITVLDLSPKVSIKDTKATISTNQLNLATSDEVTVILSWIDDEGNPIEHSAPDTLKVTLNGTEVETVVNTESGLTSELMFEVNAVGSYQVNVIGLEGVSFTDLSLTVVDTIPVVDLEKTVVSVDPETYDVEDRDNSVLKFEWKDQLGNPINNTLPGSVKIYLNGKRIRPKVKENGDNTELTIMGKSAKTQEVEVTGLKTSEVKVSITVTDVRAGVVDPTKTTFTVITSDHVLKDDKVNVIFTASVRNYRNGSVAVDAKDFTIKSKGVLIPSENVGDLSGNVNLTVEVTEAGEHTYELFYKDVKQASDVVVTVAPEQFPIESGIIANIYSDNPLFERIGVPTRMGIRVSTINNGVKIPTEEDTVIVYLNGKAKKPRLYVPNGVKDLNLIFEVGIFGPVDVKVTNLEGDTILEEKVIHYPIGHGVVTDHFRAFLVGPMVDMLTDGQVVREFRFEPRLSDGTLAPYYEDNFALTQHDTDEPIEIIEKISNEDNSWTIKFVIKELGENNIVFKARDTIVSDGTVINDSYKGFFLDVVTQEKYEEYKETIYKPFTEFKLESADEWINHDGATIVFKTILNNIFEEVIQIVDKLTVSYLDGTDVPVEKVVNEDGSITLTGKVFKSGNQTYLLNYDSIETSKDRVTSSSKDLIIDGNTSTWNWLENPIDGRFTPYGTIRADIKDVLGQQWEVDPSTIKVTTDISTVPFDLISNENGVFEILVKWDDFGRFTYRLQVEGEIIGSDKELNNTKSDPTIILSRTKASLSPSTIDLTNNNIGIVTLSWFDDEGNPIEHSAPDTLKVTLNDVEVETVVNTEPGLTSELMFEVNVVGSYQVNVIGLEGVPTLGPVTLTVVDTTPLLDLEKTVVSIDPETYDIEDRDNTVVRFDWRDQFGNPITNTLPEDVKISMNGSTITTNPKENGNNTEVVIKSTVVKSHEIVVTGLNSKDTKLTFSVTDRRLGKVAQSKTSVGYYPEVVNLYENNKVAAQFFMKDYKDNELTLPITVKAFIDGVEAEVTDIEMDDKIRTYQITVNPVTEEKNQVLSLEISYDEDGETKSFKTNSKSIKVIPIPEGIVVEPYLTGFGKYYRDVDTSIDGLIITKDGDDNKLPTKAGIWKYYANDVEITKVVETPPTGEFKDLNFEINLEDNLDVIKDGLVNFKITNLDGEVIFTKKVSIYPLKSMEMDNIASRSYLMGDRYTILENGEAHFHFLLEPRNKEGELVPYYGDDITVMDFNSGSVIPHGDVIVDGDGKYIVPLTFTEPVDLQLVIAINGGTVSDGTVMDAEFRGEAITILTQEGYDELLKEVDNSRTAIEVITKEHPLINGQARVELEVTVKNIEDREVDVNVDHFKVYEGETLIDSINTSASTGKLTMTFYSSELGEHTYTVKYNDVKSGNEVTVEVIEVTVDISLTQVSLVKEVVNIKDDSNNTLLIKWFLDELTPIENTLPEGVTFTINDEVLEVTVTEQGTSSKVDFIVPDSPGNYDLMVNGLENELGEIKFGPYSFEVVDTTSVFDASKSTWDVVETSNGEFKGSLSTKDQFGNDFNVEEVDVKLFVNGVETEYSIIPLSKGLNTFYFNFETPGTHTVRLNILDVDVKPDVEITVLDLTPRVSIKDTKASISESQLDLATSDKVTVTLDWVDQFGNPIEHNAPSDILIKLNDDIIVPVKDESGLTNTKYVLTLTTPGIYNIKLSGLVDTETNEEINFDEFPLIVTDSSLVFDHSTSTWELIDNGDGESLTCVITCKDRNGDLVITPSSQFVVKVDGIEVEVLPKQENGSIVELSFDYSVPGLHEVTILVAGEVLEPTREFTTIDRSPRLDPTQTTWSIDPVKINVNETDTFTVTINPKDQYGSDFFVSSDEVLLSIGEDILETEVVSDGDGVIVLTFKKIDLGTFSVDLNLLDEDILPSVGIEIVDGSEIDPSKDYRFTIEHSSWLLDKEEINLAEEVDLPLTITGMNREGTEAVLPDNISYRIGNGPLTPTNASGTGIVKVSIPLGKDYPLGEASIALFVGDEPFKVAQTFNVIDKVDGGEVDPSIPGFSPDKTTWDLDPRRINVADAEEFTLTINGIMSDDNPIQINEEDIIMKIDGEVITGNVTVTPISTVITFVPEKLGNLKLNVNVKGHDIIVNEPIEVVDIIDGSEIEPSFDINKSSWKLTKPKANISGEMTIALTVDSRNKEGGKTAQPWDLYYQIEDGALVQLDSKDKPNGTEYVIDVSDCPELGFYSITLFVLSEKFGESQEFEVANIDDGGEVEEPGEGCDCENRDRPYGGNSIDELLEERSESIICCQNRYPDKMEL